MIKAVNFLFGEEETMNIFISKIKYEYILKKPSTYKHCGEAIEYYLHEPTLPKKAETILFFFNKNKITEATFKNLEKIMVKYKTIKFGINLLVKNDAELESDQYFKILFKSLTNSPNGSLEKRPINEINHNPDIAEGLEVTLQNSLVFKQLNELNIGIRDFTELVNSVINIYGKNEAVGENSNSYVELPSVLEDKLNDTTTQILDKLNEIINKI